MKRTILASTFRFYTPFTDFKVANIQWCGKVPSQKGSSFYVPKTISKGILTNLVKNLNNLDCAFLCIYGIFKGSKMHKIQVRCKNIKIPKVG